MVIIIYIFLDLVILIDVDIYIPFQLIHISVFSYLKKMFKNNI
jgi:hypothetical protein